MRRESVVVVAGTNSPAWRRVRRAISCTTDIEVAEEVSGEMPSVVLSVARRARAHAVVVDLPTNGEEPGLVSHLLLESPERIVVALSPQGSRAIIFRLRTTREELDSPRPSDLIGRLREVTM